MRLFTAGLRKLVRRPATFVTFGLLVGLLALIYLAVGASVRQQPDARDARPDALLLLTFPGAYSLVLSFILGLGGLFAMIFGAAIAGSEWTGGRSRPRWRAVRAGAATSSSRSRSIAFIVGIGLLVAFVDRRDRRARRCRDRRGPDGRRRRRRDAGHAARAPRARLAGTRRGLRARVRDRHARAQPARRDRRRDRGLLRRAVRDALPAGHRQVPAVQRGERGRRDLGQRAGRHSSSSASSRTSRCSSYRSG